MFDVSPLTGHAKRYAAMASGRAAMLRKKLIELEVDRVRLQTELVLAQQAANRFRTFAYAESNLPRCPRCWICDEIQASLAPLHDGNCASVRCLRCAVQFPRYEPGGSTEPGRQQAELATLAVARLIHHRGETGSAPVAPAGRASSDTRTSALTASDERRHR